MLYYHGTDMNFNSFDLSFAKELKDFGQGIYLSQKEWHAEAVALGKNSQYAYIRVYDLDIKYVRDNFNYKEFKKAQKPWVKFILENRNLITRNNNYDVVVGATADSKAQSLIEEFYRRFRRLNREPSKKEYNELISSLAVYNYPTQMCILTQNALNYVNNSLIEVKEIK